MQVIQVGERLDLMEHGMEETQYSVERGGRRNMGDI